MPSLPPPLCAALALLAVTAGIYDWRYRRIPNWLVMAGFVGGLSAQICIAGLQGAADSLKGSGLAMAVYLPLYVLRAVGGGDLKLMIAMGAISGPGVWLVLFVLSSLLGGMAAVALTLARSRFIETLLNIRVILVEILHLRPPYRHHPSLDVTSNEGVRLPHGTVIGVATILYLYAIWLR